MTGEEPTDNELARMARGVSHNQLVRVLADYAAELLDQGLPIDEVWAVTQVLCRDLGIDPDELSRCRH